MWTVSEKDLDKVAENTATANFEVSVFQILQLC